MLTKIKAWLKHCPIYLMKWVPFLERASAFALSLVILWLMFFTGAEVVSRYFLKPIPGHLESVELIVPIFACLGLAYVQSFRGHIRVDLFIHMLKGRVYHFVESLWLALTLCLTAFYAICTFRNALDAYQVGDVTVMYDIPTWCFRLFVSIGFALLCLRLVIQLAQSLIQFAYGIEGKDLTRSRKEQ